jgi:tetratricopeptide (TPR) repeat protein
LDGDRHPAGNGYHSADTAPGTHDRNTAPGSTLLVAWRDAGEEVIGIYLFTALEPVLVRVEDTPDLWTLRTPENFPVYVNRGGDFTLPAELAAGALEMEAGNVDQASERFRILQGLPSDVPADLQDSNRAAILFAVGQGMVGEGDLAGALQTYSKALRLADDFQAARTNRGNLYLALGDAATATAAFDKVLASLPGYLPPLYNRAIAHQVGGDLTAAFVDAGQLITLRPDAAWSFNLRGFLHYSQADYEDALGDFAQATAADPDAVIPLFNQATTLYALGDYDKALSAYEVILESEPDNPVFYLYRGLALQAMGDYAQARLAYTRAIILDAGYVDAYLRRARLRLELAEYDRALADCEKALALDPDDGRAYAIIGDVDLAQENFVEAEQAYTAAIERGQAGPEVYAGRGWAWQRRRYAPTAVKDYEQALQLGANDPLLLYRLGFAYFEVGLYKEALDALLGAVNGGLDTAEAHAALSLALDANLQRAEAEQEYRRAIELDPSYGDIDFLVEQPLWSETAVARAQTILRRLESE